MLFIGKINAQTVNYTILKNDPDDYNKTSLKVYPLCMETFVGYGLSYAISGETKIGNFMPKIQFNKSYLELLVSHIKDNKNLKPHNTIDIGATYFFSDRNTDQNVNVKLSERSLISGNTIYTTVTSVQVPGTVKHLSGINFGVYSTNVPMTIESAIVNGKVQYYNFAQVDTNIVAPENYSDRTTMSHIKGIYLGFKSRTVTNLQISTDGWGKKSRRVISDFSFDLFFAPSITIDNMIDKNNIEWKLTPAAKMVRHLGWKATFAKQYKYFGYFWDLGWKPAMKARRKGLGSIMDNGFCLDLGFYVTLGTNKAFLQKK
jgi:hypothetical protein